MPLYSLKEIILTWDNYSSDDVDLYVETPDQKVVYFANRESDGGLVTLDRDDLGINDQTIVNNQVINDPNRDETISIRGNLEGHYVVTANLYNYRDASNLETGDRLPKPVHVKIQIIQLDPPKGIVYSEIENLTISGQELYLVDFDIKDGYVINIENNHPTSVMELIARSSSFVPADASQ